MNTFDLVPLTYKVLDIPNDEQGVLIQAPMGYSSPYLKILRKENFITIASCYYAGNTIIPDNNTLWVVNFNNMFMSDYNVAVSYGRLHYNMQLDFVTREEFTLEHLLIACASFGLNVMYPTVVYSGEYRLPQ